jgi:hypothetical protein
MRLFYIARKSMGRAQICECPRGDVGAPPSPRKIATVARRDGCPSARRDRKPYPATNGLNDERGDPRHLRWRGFFPGVCGAIRRDSARWNRLLMRLSTALRIVSITVIVTTILIGVVYWRRAEILGHPLHFGAGSLVGFIAVVAIAIGIKAAIHIAVRHRAGDCTI